MRHSRVRCAVFEYAVISVGAAVLVWRPVAAELGSGPAEDGRVVDQLSRVWSRRLDGRVEDQLSRVCLRDLNVMVGYE